MSLLISKLITLSDTALGRHQPITMSELNSVVTKMSREERGVSRKKLEKINEMDDKEHWYFIFMVDFGHFLQNGHQKTAYIIYLTDVWSTQTRF